MASEAAIVKTTEQAADPRLSRLARLQTLIIQYFMNGALEQKVAKDFSIQNVAPDRYQFFSSATFRTPYI